MWAYPIGRLWVEAAHARRRVNLQTATELTGIAMAIGAVIAGGDEFEKMLKRLTDDG